MADGDDRGAGRRASAPPPSPARGPGTHGAAAISGETTRPGLQRPGAGAGGAPPRGGGGGGGRGDDLAASISDAMMAAAAVATRVELLEAGLSDQVRGEVAAAVCGLEARLAALEALGARVVELEAAARRRSERLRALQAWREEEEAEETAAEEEARARRQALLDEAAAAEAWATQTERYGGDRRAAARARQEAARLRAQAEGVATVSPGVVTPSSDVAALTQTERAHLARLAVMDPAWWRTTAGVALRAGGWGAVIVAAVVLLWLLGGGSWRGLAGVLGASGGGGERHAPAQPQGPADAGAWDAIRGR